VAHIILVKIRLARLFSKNIFLTKNISVVTFLFEPIEARRLRKTRIVMSKAPSKTLTTSLWVVQILLALAFGMAGLMKLTTPAVELAKMLPFSVGLARFIGVSELAGALGLLLPALTRIRPLLTPLAASGLVLVMILAAIFHILRGEFGSVPVNFILGGLASFVAWGRLSAAPITAR
jgi:putative oxidoreductase